MKRFMKRLSLVGLAALVFMLSACDLTELNENPNESADVSTPNLLANAQQYLAETYWKDYAGGFWVRYAQYWTTNQYTDADRYRFPTRRPGANDANWSRFYLALNDLEEIKRINRQTPEDAAGFGPAENQIAVAQVMQAFTWQMMTDMWGPIPFEEALRGREEGNFNPSYSSQEDIYLALIDSLTAASNMIDTSAPTMASGDLVYGGDMEQWKKLANALKMRIAIRMADVNSSAAQSAIQEALDAGALESNDDNAAIPFASSQPYLNPYYEQYEVTGRDDWAATATVLDVMNATEDPRRGAYYSDADPDTPGGQYNGFPYGVSSDNAVSLFNAGNYSRPSDRVRGEPTAPAFIMFYDEVLFTLAEAAERWGVGSQTAEQYYEDAIAASLEYWGVTDQGAIDDYIANVPYDNSNDWVVQEDGHGEWRQTLGTQKWLALYMQGMQGWAEVRRLDLQEVLHVPEDNPGRDSFGCDFPLRMEYPNNEAAVNGENRDAAVGDYLGGADSQGSALWWDVNTPECE